VHAKKHQSEPGRSRKATRTDPATLGGQPEAAGHGEVPRPFESVTIPSFLRSALVAEQQTERFALAGGRGVVVRLQPSASRGPPDGIRSIESSAVLPRGGVDS
jgi:hypothetical protein